MSELVFDAAGERYYETGASHAVFYPHTGGAYVWNGLTGVDLSPTEEAPENLFYDGKLRMKRQKPTEFAATINTVHTPRAFDICEGAQEIVAGLKSHLHRRVRFNLVWMTKIANDLDENLAFKIHIVYNALVAPPQRSFQTVSDIPTPEARSIPITATRCGASAYYTFDSRDASLFDLMTTINAGTLPDCSGLAALVGGVPPVEEDICTNMITDFENYNPGQLVDVDLVNGVEVTRIEGVINNGYDVIELPANGTFTANDSLATIVGSGNILTDDDNSTYITSGEGDLGYTIALPLFTGGYVPGCRFELHIRMSIDGGVNPDDPDLDDAEAQVHISTDPEGLLTVGGFSDGAQEGMAFKLKKVVGNIIDYVIPLKMDSWINSSISDVVGALSAGAYLNVLGASNFNPDAALLPVEVRVYEAKIVMIDNTDSGRFLRVDPATGNGRIEQHIRAVVGGSIDEVQAFTNYVDFKIKEIPEASGAPDSVMIVEFEDDVPGSLKAEFVGDAATLAWRDEASTGTADVTIPLSYNVWYRARVYWTWGVANVKVWARDREVVYLIDRSMTPSNPPKTQAAHNAGLVSS